MDLLVSSVFCKLSIQLQYSPLLKHLPVPKMICFYNGTDEKEDRTILALSDAFGGKERKPLTGSRLSAGQ